MFEKFRCLQILKKFRSLLSHHQHQPQIQQRTHCLFSHHLVLVTWHLCLFFFRRLQAHRLYRLVATTYVPLSFGLRSPQSLPSPQSQQPALRQDTRRKKQLTLVSVCVFVFPVCFTRRMNRKPDNTWKKVKYTKDKVCLLFLLSCCFSFFLYVVFYIVSMSFYVYKIKISLNVCRVQAHDHCTCTFLRLKTRQVYKLTRNTD
jgi:hypothetical protein